MSSLQQILLGSGLLASSAVIHVLAVGLSVPLFRNLARFFPDGKHPLRRLVAFLLLTVAILLAAHTVQIWGWAVVFILLSD